MTGRARAAFAWAAANATPGTIWGLDGPPNSKSIVYFMVLGYESIADPEHGCTLEIGRFKVSERGRWQAVESAANLPSWFMEAQNGRPYLITAVRFKELVSVGTLSKSAMHL